MSLNRKSFKQAILTISFAAVVGSGTFWFTGGFDNLNKVNVQNEGMKEQIELVQSAINEEYVQNQSNESSINNQVSSVEEYIPKYDFDKLREINPNIIGVIEGDIFEGGYYPVVSSDSFDELNSNLYRSVDGSENSIGTITVDPNSNGNMQGNVVRLWGHHFANEEDNGKMFSSLVNYDSQEFYNGHKTLKYYTEFGEYELEIFACTKDNPLEQEVGYVNDLEANMNEVMARSMISSDVKPGERVMILTTCPKEGSINSGDNRISVYSSVHPVYEKTMNNSKTM